MAGYDTYYEVEDLFGAPYTELISYMEKQERGKVLDLGCGQGRDAVVLARMGFNVTGVDHSQVGINQMVQLARKESLTLDGQVGDVFEFDNVEVYDFVLLDSMFHFAKKDRDKETKLIKRIIQALSSRAQMIVCIQDSGKKVDILKETVAETNGVVTFESSFVYLFEDMESGHQSKTNYQLLVVSKAG